MPNDQNVEASVIVHDRGRLLKAMDLFHPAAMTYGMILQTLPTVEEKNVQRDLWYLLDSKCATCTNAQPNMAWREKEFQLTSHGHNVARGIEHDPGIKL